MRVHNAMSRIVTTVDTADSIRTAARAMQAHRCGAVVVRDAAGDEVGVATERDVLRAVAEGLDLDATPVTSIATTDVITVTPEEHLAEAGRLMGRHGFRHLPVVEDGRTIGMVSAKDAVRTLSRLPMAVRG